MTHTLVIRDGERLPGEGPRAGAAPHRRPRPGVPPHRRRHRLLLPRGGAAL